MNRTKQNLIDVAIPLMAKNGVYGVSLRDIAKKAEINVSSVLYHFGSKEEFITTCGEHCINLLTEQIKEISKQTFDSVEELNKAINLGVEQGKEAIAICVMLLVIDSPGFRDIYEGYVSDSYVSVHGQENPFLLNLRSFISYMIFKRVDLKVAKEKYEGSGMVELLCQSPIAAL